MKIIFYFNGTSGPKLIPSLFYPNELNIDNKEKIPYREDVIRVYIRGCEHEKVGNGTCFPNLEIITQYLKSAFNDDNTFNIKKLIDDTKNDKEEGWLNINFEFCKEYINSNKEALKVDEIVIEGFSRGGVTAFALASELDSLGIPLHVIANQPVPGELVPELGLYNKYHNLTHCKNIRSATQLLATHPINQGIRAAYLKQMIAQFPINTAVSTFYIPQQDHERDSLIASFHLGNTLLNLGFVQNDHKEKPANFEEKIKAWYDGYHMKYNRLEGWQRLSHRYCFTPTEIRQEIYGVQTSIPHDPYYVQWLQNKATAFMTNQGINRISEINEEQAASIFSISKAGYPSELNQQMIEFLLGDKGMDCRQVINKTEEICEYLTKSCAYEHKTNYKGNALCYKKAIFKLSYEYFSGKKGLTEKKNFKEALYQEELKFRKDALHSHADTFRFWLKILTNFITHCSGIGLIINVVHKYQTGNWLLFNHNEHVDMVRDNRMNLCDQFNI